MSRRAEALSLYRSFLRVAQQMPSHTRMRFVQLKVRQSYEESRHKTKREDVDFLLRLGYTQLDTARVQVEHLNEMNQEGQFIG